MFLLYNAKLQQFKIFKIGGCNLFTTCYNGLTKLIEEGKHMLLLWVLVEIKVLKEKRQKAHLSYLEIG